MNIEDHIYCPITHQIFLEPVLANDAITYEKDALETWLKRNKMSPTNRNVEITSYHVSLIMRNIVSEYLEKNPDKQIEQYSGSTNIDKIIMYVEKNKEKCNLDEFVKIYERCNIFQSEKFTCFCVICQYAPPEIIKYVIDNCENLECIDNDCMKPIHYICQKSTPEMIKYIIDKGVDLECVDKLGMKPIHVICRYSTPEMIKYIIDKRVNLEHVTNDGWKPIHYICLYSTAEIIRYIIDKGVDLQHITNYGHTPIYYLKCNNSLTFKEKYYLQNELQLYMS